MLNQVQKVSTAQAVVEQIVSLMKSGVLAPGDRLPSENELVEMLGVGRSSVREAKQSLVAMNLIEAHPGRGSFVRELSPGDSINPDIIWLLLADEHVWALHEVRELLEVQVAGLAAQRATEEDFAALEVTLRDLAAAVASGISVYDAGMAFHLAVVEAAHNAVLVSLYQPIVGLLNEYQRPFYETRSDPQGELRHHQAIYDSLKQKDSALAQRTMRAHLQYVAATTEHTLPEGLVKKSSEVG